LFVAAFYDLKLSNSLYQSYKNEDRICQKKQIQFFHISFSYGFVLKYELLCKEEIVKMVIVRYEGQKSKL